MLRAVKLQVAASLCLEVLVEAFEVVRPRTASTKDNVTSVVAYLTMLIKVNGKQTKQSTTPYILIIDRSLFLTFDFS